MRDTAPTWFAYVLAIWFAWSAALVWKGVGEPRKPITRTTAVGVTIVSVLIISGVILVGA